MYFAPSDDFDKTIAKIGKLRHNLGKINVENCGIFA